MAASASSGPRNEVRAGLITLATITVLAAGVISLPKVLRAAPIEYRIRGSAAVDLTGLDVESPVLVGGLQRGRVLSVESEPLSDGRTAALVRFEIAATPPLFPGARARVVRNLISQKAAIDFVATGSPRQSRQPLDPDSILPLDDSDEGAESFFSPAMRKAATSAWEHIQNARQSWPEATADAKRRFNEVKDNSLLLRDEISATWPDLRTRATELYDRFGGLKADFRRLGEEVQSAKSELDAVRALTDDGAEWPRLRDAFAEFGSSWSKLRAEAGTLADLFAGATNQGARVRDMASKLLATIREFGASLRYDDIIADLTLAATQFGKLYDEAFAAPLTVLLRNESSVDRQRAALDDLGRALLQGADDASRAQASMRLLLDTSAIAGEAGADAMGRLDRAIDDLRSLEHALWQLRTNDDPRR